MKYKIMCAFAMFAFAVVATPAQMKGTMSGKCAKPDINQAVPVGDRDGHAYMVQQGKCTATTEVNGVKAKDGVFSETDDAMGMKVKGTGVFVATFESGDKVFYSYWTTAATKDNMITTGTNKYTISGGTGKMKGIKGTGTCTLKGTADGSVDFDCTGDYTMPAMKMMAPKK